MRAEGLPDARAREEKSWPERTGVTGELQQSAACLLIMKRWFFFLFGVT